MKTKKTDLDSAQSTKEIVNAHLDFQFAIERYKFILNEVHSLNENFHKYLTLFQTLATAIVGVTVSLFVSRQSLQISPDITIAGMRGLLGLLALLSLFVIILVVSGIASWLDYRKEEVELLNSFLGLGFRKTPSLKNFWRWHETYLLIFIVLFNIAVLLVIEKQLIPLIK